jgi:hypothetical protein
MENRADRVHRIKRRLAAGLAVLCFLMVSALSSAATGPDQYEVDDHHYRARNLALNGVEQSHTFHDGADEDWLSFYAVKETIYFLGTREYPGVRCNTVFELYNAAGKMIDDELGSFAETRVTGYGEPEQITWQCPADGIYYLRVLQADPEVFGDDTEYAIYLWDGSGPEGEMPVRGIVTDSKSTKPIQGARVKLIKTSNGVVQGIAVTDSRGRFQLSAMDGHYRLEARATGHAMQSKSVTVQGEPVTAYFALAPTTVSKPDLTVTAVSGPAAAKPGGSITVRSTVKNLGSVASGNFNLYIYLSEVPYVDFGRSRLLKIIKGLALDAGARNALTNTMKVPLDCQAGAYRIVVSADQDGRVAESNETNNRKASLNSVMVE